MPDRNYTLFTHEDVQNRSHKMCFNTFMSINTYLNHNCVTCAVWPSWKVSIVAVIRLFVLAKHHLCSQNTIPVNAYIRRQASIKTCFCPGFHVAMTFIMSCSFTKRFNSAINLFVLSSITDEQLVCKCKRRVRSRTVETSCYRLVMLILPTCLMPSTSDTELEVTMIGLYSC